MTFPRKLCPACRVTWIISDDDFGICDACIGESRRQIDAQVKRSVQVGALQCAENSGQFED